MRTMLPAKLVFRHDAAPCCSLDHGPLSGLRHRTVLDARSGLAQLALWQEEHLPGFQVPPHRHDCEEIITVLEGAIEAEVEGEFHAVGAGESVVLPEWCLHGFRVTSARPVRLLAIFGSSSPGIFRADGTPSSPPWEGGASHHLEE